MVPSHLGKALSKTLLFAFVCVCVCARARVGKSEGKNFKYLRTEDKDITAEIKQRVTKVNKTCYGLKKLNTPH